MFAFEIDIDNVYKRLSVLTIFSSRYEKRVQVMLFSCCSEGAIVTSITRPCFSRKLLTSGTFDIISEATTTLAPDRNT